MGFFCLLLLIPGPERCLMPAMAAPLLSRLAIACPLVRLEVRSGLAISPDIDLDPLVDCVTSRIGPDQHCRSAESRLSPSRQSRSPPGRLISHREWPKW